MFAHMAWRGIVLMLLSCVAALLEVGWSTTSPNDTSALRAIRSSLNDSSDSLGSWRGDDPCGSGWVGVYCVASDYPQASLGGNISRVTELRLAQRNLAGQLAAAVGNLSALKYLNLMENNLSGPIPATIGNLSNLHSLVLRGNRFGGVLPDELSLLQNLTRMQLDGNLFTGAVPDSFSNANLPNLEYLQLSNNALNDTIPVGLTTISTLQHLMLDHNQLTGYLPEQLSSIPNLQSMWLGNNNFDEGATIPESYGGMPQLVTLSMSNCSLQGDIPNFSLATHLAVLDLSHNSLSGTLANAGLNAANLTTLDLSYNDLSGSLPDYLSVFPWLLFLELRGNNFSGPVPPGLSIDRNTSSIVDLQNTLITSFANESDLLTLQRRGKGGAWLWGTPFCAEPVSPENSRICSMHNVTAILNTGEVTPVPSPSLGSSCGTSSCRAPAAAAPDSSQGRCRCAVPISVQARLSSPGFAIFDPYWHQFMTFLASGLGLYTNQIQIESYVYEPGPHFLFSALLFPSRDQFSDDEQSTLFSTLANWNYAGIYESTFGPVELKSFSASPYVTEESNGSSRKHSSGLSTAAIVAIVLGALVFIVLKTLCMYYVLRWWLLRRSAMWEYKSDKITPVAPARNQSLVMRRGQSSVKISGVREFSFAEIVRATDDFSADRLVGEGGYGKVYSGYLEDGSRVAIKRAEEGSHQGLREFETELQLLSRVHHRNLVGLVGYCNDEGEQVLVYEFVAHSSLQQHVISSTSRLPINFLTRLQIALDSARGIHYLHTMADPPVYHRDIKASNILLDEMFHAKVSDFGLSKLAPRPDLLGAVGHVSTVVKGTPGYLDPEYFKTHRLTDKSDVYSFGVVLLVLITGAQPINEGKNVVREVSKAFAMGELFKIVDFRIRGAYPHRAMQTLTMLALACCRDSPDERPNITEVLARLEQLWRENFFVGRSDDGESVDGHSTYSIDLRQGYSTRSEESYIEIDPSTASSSVDSSTVWTISGRQDSGHSKEEQGIDIVNPR